MPSFIAPADAIRKAIEADRRRAPPIFRTNEPVGLKKPEPDAAPARPRPDTRVWHDTRRLTTSAAACAMLGDD